MKKVFLSVLLIGLLTGCASVKSPVTGFWYTDVKSGDLITESAKGTKMGQACSETILGLVAMGDSTIETAMKSGKITKVTHVDYTANSILGFYGKYCTVVHGN